MYTFVAGDVLRSGKTNMDSVKKCLEYVVGKGVPSTDELMVSDFNMNGKIDLSDTLNVLRIVEASKKPMFVSGKNVVIDKELVRGNVLGVLAHLNAPNTMTFSLGANWSCVQNGTRVYIENVQDPSPLETIGALESVGASISRFEIVFERDGVMYYVRE